MTSADDRDGEAGEDPARAPAVVVPLDQRIREPEEADRRGDKSRQIEALLLRLVTALGDDEARDDDARDPDRDVDEEDPAPVDLLGEDAADQRADRKRHRGHADPDADRCSALPRWEGGDDDRKRRRVHQRRSNALHDAGADQVARAGREAARERGGREDRQADDEDQAPAEQVSELAAREHEHGERERVTADHPLELGLRDVEVALDRGQRHEDDRVVEHDHEQPEGDRAQRPPLAVLLCEYSCSHGLAPSSG